MSDISPVAPAEAQVPVEEHPSAEAGGRKAPRRPRRPIRDSGPEPKPPHILDLEA